MNGTTSCRDACLACDDVANRVHLPLGHVEIVPFESSAESLTLGLQHEMEPFLQQGDDHVPFQSIIHVPELCCLSSESAERRSILTYEVFLFSRTFRLYLSSCGIWAVVGRRDVTTEGTWYQSMCESGLVRCGFCAMSGFPSVETEAYS